MSFSLKGSGQLPTNTSAAKAAFSCSLTAGLKACSTLFALSILFLPIPTHGFSPKPGKSALH
jgi:hypothetical protein